MSHIDHRTLLSAFGIASVSSMLPVRAAAAGKVAVAKPGENRFAFGSAAQIKTSPCKVSSDDSAGACTVFELNALPRSGPFLHVHHREDEWYYVLYGEFLFRAGGEELSLLTGGSIWLPRCIPHVWANTAAADGKWILMCQPGGLRSFLTRSGKWRWTKRVPIPCEISWRSTAWKCWDRQSLLPPGCSNIRDYQHRLHSQPYDFGRLTGHPEVEAGRSLPEIWDTSYLMPVSYRAGSRTSFCTRQFRISLTYSSFSDGHASS
jgi:mannose-6-phosphate isomerase-like protein (cupin superfamily)